MPTQPASINAYLGPVTAGTPSIRTIYKAKDISGFPEISLLYADLGDSEWGYVLTLEAMGDDKVTGITNVDVNATMNSGITASSFVVYDKQFYVTTNELYLKTGYKNTSRNIRVVEQIIQILLFSNTKISDRPFGPGILFSFTMPHYPPPTASCKVFFLEVI